MGSRRAEITMSEFELSQVFDEVQTITLGTVGSDGSPHLSAMWFAHIDAVEGVDLIGGRGHPGGVSAACNIVFWTYTRAQKTVNMQRDPRVTVLIEAGTSYPELRGAMVRGRAHLTDNVEQVRAIGAAVIRSNNASIEPAAAWSQAGAQASKRTGVRFEPLRVASWDHRKL